MQKRLFLLPALCCALLLGACGAKQPAETPQIAQPSAAAEPAADLPAAEPASAERAKVENNGGQFVRVGEQIWFRYYDEGTIDESRLWGEFLSGQPSHPVTSKLCYYDLSSDAVNEAFADDGFGPLWFGVDGFYLTRPADDDPKYGGEDLPTAYYRALDGTAAELCDGIVEGVSDNGRFAAVLTWSPSAEGDALRVYEGTEKTAAVPKIEGAWPQFCAVGDDGALIYLTGDGLCEQDASGRTYVLGALPAAPEGSYEWELEQCLLSGDEVWCAFGSYEGTGHFLCDVLCVRATRGAENSLETVEDEVTTEYPFVPKLYVDASGEVRRAEHKPGEVGLNDGLRGDLVVYEEGAERVIALNFLPSNIYNDEGCGKIVQTVENVGEAAYLIVADAYRDADSDVGWRMAYRPGTLYYLRVPFDGSGVETLYGAAWDAAQKISPAEVYAGFIGEWKIFATEVEGYREDTLPDGMDETVRFYADGVRAVIDSSNGENSYYNDFDHAEALPTNGVSENAGEYGLLFTADGTDDMMWTYLEGDTLVATVMMHFQTEYGSDSVSRTGFYKRVE